MNSDGVTIAATICPPARTLAMSDLSELGSPNGGSFYVLRSATASLAEVREAGLFELALSCLHPGDLLLVTYADGSLVCSVDVVGELTVDTLT